MLRIALIAYDISPYRGSEASVSWNFVSHMNQRVKLTVIYGSDHREIDNYIASHPMPNIEWINIPKKDVEHFGRGLKQDIYYTIYYRQWHRQVAQTIQSLVDDEKIDLIHYLNPIGFKEPGWAWKIKSVPYVWGPVQGVDNRPLKLYKALRAKGTIFAIVRRLLHNGLFRFHTRVRKAFRRADAIFAATPATVRGLKRHHRKEATYLPENGIVEMERTTPIKFNNSQPLRLIWIGGIDVDRKAIGLLLDALLKVKSTNWRLDVFGDGTLSEKNKTKSNLLGSKITYHGKVDRAQVQKTMDDSHLHIISSLGEGNTTVIWEAMAKAIPTMTLDHCGMAGVVCKKCGIKIPIQSYRHTTDRIAREIDDIIQHPERINQLSNGVIQCSKKFMWSNRIDLFINTYSQLIDKKARQRANNN